MPETPTIRLHYPPNEGGRALNAYLASLPTESGTTAETVLEALLMVPSKARTPHTPTGAIATDDGFVQRGWAEPGGVSKPQSPVLIGVEALLSHHYLLQHREGFLEVLGREGVLRGWVLGRVLADRTAALEAHFQAKIPATHSWAKVGPEMPLLPRALRRWSSPKTAAEAESLLVGELRTRKGLAPEKPGVYHAVRGFEAVAECRDILPVRWLEGHGVPPTTRLREMKEGRLLDLVQDFLASEEARVHLDDPRLAPLGTWVWAGHGPMPTPQLKEVVRWQLGARKGKGQTDFCRGCGFPVWEMLDRVQYDTGWGLAGGKGAGLANAWRLSDHRDKGELRMACLLCRTAKLLVEQGSLRKVGERGIWIRNCGANPIPKGRIWHYVEAEPVLTGRTPTQEARTASRQAGDILLPGETLCVGAEMSAMAGAGMPDSRRRQMGRWGLVYQGLSLEGHTVAVGFRHHLGASGLFGVLVPADQAAKDLEVGRTLLAGIRKLTIQAASLGDRMGDAARSLLAREGPEKDRAGAVYAMDARQLGHQLMRTLAELREGGSLENKIKSFRMKRETLLNLYHYLTHQGGLMAHDTEIRLTDEIAFWAGPAQKVFVRPNKRSNLGETTLALREAVQSAQAAHVPFGTPLDVAQDVQVQAAKAALVGRIQPFIKRDDQPFTQAVVTEASIRVERLVRLPANVRQRMANAICDGIRQTCRHKLDWDAIQSASPDTLEEAVARRRAASTASPTSSKA